MTQTPTAVVTGASRGIGRGVAIRLAATHRVIAVARNERLLRALCDEIARTGGECRPVVADLGSRDDIERALSGISADVLVNNAGVITRKPFLELTPDEWHEMMAVNVSALFHVTRQLLPGMIHRRHGHVINIASIAGRSAFPGGTGYVATKHAVLGFSESLMLEVREFGVKVSVIMPGSVATDMVVSDSSDRSWMLQPDDVAHVVEHILSMPSHALTYQVEVRASNPKKG